MQALRFHEFGSFEKLKVETIPDPQPKPGEVVVRIRAASLSPSDAKNVLGRMEGTTLPRTPGRDFAGVVVNGLINMIGAEVWGTGGDIGFTRDGAQAELLLVPIGGVRPKPRNLSFEEAAVVGVNFVTAWIGLIETVRFQSGETVLATGAAGGVGSAVTQIAKWKGGRTIGVVRAPISQETQKRFGINHFIVSDPNDNYKSMIDGALRFSEGKGVNVVFDCVGGALFEPCLKTLGQLGRQANITSVGDRRVCFDLLDFYHRRLSLYGVDSRAYDTEACAAILEQLTPGFESAALKPIPIAKEFTLNEAVQAYTEVNDGTLQGKAVFTFPAGA
ncbi:MAG TPA: zinc-binding alcohol dehydrogenase family protein [Candidatus Acidoferrales bacterium]|nr:zinc-binding alcohol dehydrogenase family protein [Candidatus Acidoferrales bacterium]